MRAFTLDLVSVAQAENVTASAKGYRTWPIARQHLPYVDFVKIAQTPDSRGQSDQGRNQGRTDAN